MNCPLLLCIFIISLFVIYFYIFLNINLSCYSMCCLSMFVPISLFTYTFWRMNSDTPVMSITNSSARMTSKDASLRFPLLWMFSWELPLLIMIKKQLISPWLCCGLCIDDCIIWMKTAGTGSDDQSANRLE